MSLLLDTIASYVPSTLVRRFAANPATASQPVSDRFEAATLFADISGFTQLTEQLSRSGPAGEEELTQLLNDYFDELVQLINSHGGEVVKFAGDALLAMWPMGDDTLANVTLRATQCGLAIQERLHNYEASGDVRLSMYVGIGAGPVFSSTLGGVYGRQEYLVSGGPLIDMSLAQQKAEPGQVVLAPRAWAFVEKHCSGTPLDEGFVLVESVSDGLEPIPLSEVVVPDELEGILRAFVPGAIVARLGAGQSGWLAELRRVSVLFVNLPDLNYRISAEKAQEIMRLLQTSLYRYEGSINKLNVDDKGTTLVAALGLPPLSHQDDPARAVLAALAMRDALREMDISCAIGVATGRAFCGSVGSLTRREYTMIGEVVNLAARLMQEAQKQGLDVLCGDTTYEQSNDRVHYEALPPVKLKGRSGEVAIFEPLGEVETAIRPQTEIIGRDDERAILADHIQALLRGSPGGLVVVEGDAGIGKTQLINDLRQQAQSLGVTTFRGGGDAIERTTPYFAWRGVFNQLLDLDVLTDPDDRRQHLLNLLELEPELLSHAPLINQVLGLDLPDTEETSRMTGQTRAEATRDFLAKLIQSSVIQSAKVIILEDAHWLDSASWALAYQVTQNVKPLLTVIASRPLNDPVPPEFEQLMAVPNLERILLSPLDRADTVTLIRQRLGIGSVPQVVVDLIYRKAEGHPFFSEELAYALRDSGVLVVEDDDCRISPEAGNLSSVSLPDTIEGIITSRVDRLAAPEQLTLKVTSVIGRTFPYRTLYDIHPIEADRPRLSDYLDTFVRLDITKLETPEPDLAYIYKHIITQEVVYNMMTYSQRQQLHEAAAQWYERTYKNDLEPYYPLLAHHWARTEEFEKAAGYAENAGKKSMHEGANAEAKAFFELALSALLELPETKERNERYVDIAISLSRVSAFLPAENLPALLERALGFSEALGDEVRQARVISSTGAYYYMHGQMGPAFEHFGKGMVMAEKLGLEELLLLPSDLIGRGHVFSGNHAEAEKLLSRSIELGEKFEDFELMSGSLVWYSLNALFQGEREKAMPYAERSFAVSRELGHPSRIAIASTLLGLLHFWNGLLEEAKEYSSSGLEIAMQTGDLHQLIGGHAGLGAVAMYEGNYEVAREHLDESIEIAEGVSVVFVPMFMAYRAELELLMGGSWDDAFARVEAAAQLAEATRQRPATGEAQRFMGRILAAAPDPDWDKVEETFTQAIELHREDNRRPFVAATLMDLGLAYQKKGDSEQAQKTLSEAYAIAEMVGMDWYVEQLGETIANF